MARRSQPSARYSPGCGSRVKARTLASELQGEAIVSRAFEGYASSFQHPDHAVLARPKAPRRSRGALSSFLQEVITRLRRWFLRA